MQGIWGVGLATPLVRLDTVPLGNDTHSWVLSSDGTSLHNGEVIGRVKEKLAEGDILVSVAAELRVSSLSRNERLCSA